MLGAATKVAGVAGSRMSSAMGKAAGHISTGSIAIKRTSNQVLAHDAQGKLLGQLMTGHQGDALRINQAWVDPEARGMGVYKRMLGAMKDEAIAAEKPLIHGDVVNKDLQRKFQREGLLNVSSMSTQSDTPSYMRTLEMMRAERYAASTSREPVEQSLKQAIIQKDNTTPVAAEALAELSALNAVPRPKPPPPPTPDKGMLMQPRHSTARYGIPKRSKG